MVSTRYQHCWPVFANDCQAVLLVYNPLKEEHIGELEQIHGVWSSTLELSPTKYLVVAQKWKNDEPAVNMNEQQKQASRSRLLKMGASA